MVSGRQLKSWRLFYSYKRLIRESKWCAVQDLNLRPSPRQGDALPTELTARVKTISEIARYANLLHSWLQHTENIALGIGIVGELAHTGYRHFGHVLLAARGFGFFYIRIDVIYADGAHK